MVTAFTEAMLSTAADIAPRAKRCQGQRGWCSSEETKADTHTAWQEREAARELFRVDPGDSNLRRTLKAAGNAVKRVKFEAVRTGDSNLRRTLKAAGNAVKRVKFEAVRIFFEEVVSQLEARINDGDQAGFYKHLKGVNLEGRRSCGVQYIKDEQGRLYFETWDSFTIGGYSGSTLYSILSRQRSTLTSPKGSMCGLRAYLWMIYLRSLR